MNVTTTTLGFQKLAGFFYSGLGATYTTTVTAGTGEIKSFNVLKRPLSGSAAGSVGVGGSSGTVVYTEDADVEFELEVWGQVTRVGTLVITSVPTGGRQGSGLASYEVSPSTLDGIVNPKTGAVMPLINAVSASSLGILPNTGVDLAPAINAALAAFPSAGSTFGNVLFLDIPGTYDYGSLIQMPNGCSIQSFDKRMVRLKALASFPTNTHHVRLGPTGSGFGFGSALKNLTLDCNNVVDSTGVLNERGQEGSGLLNCVVTGFGRYGNFVNGSAGPVANTSNENNEYYCSDTATGTVYGSYYINSGGAHQYDRNTSRNVGTTLGVMTAGLFVQDCIVTGQANHFEYATNGVLLGGNNTNVHLDGITTSGSATVTNLVNYGTGSPRSVFTNIQKAGATNAVVNSFASMALSATDTFVPTTAAQTNLAYRARTAITVTGSPFAYRNTRLYNELVMIQGGTVSLVEYSADGGTYDTVGAGTNGMYYVPVGQFLRVTYSVAPTMFRVNMTG